MDYGPLWSALWIVVDLIDSELERCYDLTKASTLHVMRSCALDLLEEMRHLSRTERDR